LVKDYDAIMLFGLGLVLAIVAYLLFIIHRRDATLRNKPWFKGFWWTFGWLAALSGVAIAYTRLRRH
jgi:hypothetical protein